MEELITLDQFIGKHIGQECTHPLGMKGQCVCLFRCYCDEVLGVPQPAGVVGAYQLWTTYNPAFFTRIPNTLLAVPRRGDVAIFKPWATNEEGHVCIVTSPGFFSFGSFDSNWSVPLTARLETHRYHNPEVLGWLRKIEHNSLLLRVNEAIRAAVGPEFVIPKVSLYFQSWVNAGKTTVYSELVDDIRGAYKNHQAPF